MPDNSLRTTLLSPSVASGGGGGGGGGGRRCTVCGGIVGKRGRLAADGRAWCSAHSDLLKLDAPPPDPLTSLPMQAGDLTYAEAVAAARERGHT